MTRPHISTTEGGTVYTCSWYGQTNWRTVRGHVRARDALTRTRQERSISRQPRLHIEGDDPSAKPATPAVTVVRKACSWGAVRCQGQQRIALMWGMEDHGGLDLTETETETDLTPAGYKATTGYPSHNANHRTTGSIMPPCIDPVQGRCPQSPDSPGATGILYGRLLEGGFLFGVALVLRRRRKQVDIGFVSPRALLGDQGAGAESTTPDPRCGLPTDEI